eukprot:gene3650-4192_t
MTPKEVVLKWVEIFNKADALALSELYHDDAVNYQVANVVPVEGKDKIYEMFKGEFGTLDMVCIIEMVHQTDGEWAILEWKSPHGMRGCGFFQVTDDKIKYQRGYWDKLSFLREQNLPFPTK